MRTRLPPVPKRLERPEAWPLELEKPEAWPLELEEVIGATAVTEEVDLEAPMAFWTAVPICG